MQSGFALLVGLGIGALVMLVHGYDPLTAYFHLFEKAFGSVPDLMESLAFATPLMLTALAFAVGIKSGLFNIGVEGQVYWGALGAVIIGGTIALPAGLHLLAATAFAMLFGALWALLPAILKAWRGVHEVISTIMLNWIAFWLVMYFVVEHFAMPGRAEITVPALETARYPLLWEGTTLTAAVFAAVAFCFVVYIFLWRTKIGYELRLVGDNPDAARYAGLGLRRVVLISFIIGGLAAGVAGATQILGRPPHFFLFATMGNVMMFGFLGIGVALIGRNHPLGVIFAATFYGGLMHGGKAMEWWAGVPSELVETVLGLIIIALAVPEALALIRRKFKW